MTDLCLLNVTQCFNNGTCVMNYSLNTSSCLCQTCHGGDFCEDTRIRQKDYDTKYVNLIIYCVAFCISVLNNSMSLELFIKCKSIRRTNCGIYLIIYSILALISSTLLVIDGIVDYDQKVFSRIPHARDKFHCVVGIADYNTAVFLCIWFSACVQLERGLLVYRKVTRNSTRKQSIIVSILLLIMGSACSIPIAAGSCDWDGIPALKTLRVFFMFFYISIPILIYLIATVFSFVGFAGRIRAYRLETQCYMRTFAKLTYSHLFIFIPPLVYGFCFGLFNLVAKGETDKGYFFCGISLAEYIIKVLLKSLMGLPFIITWLVFIYPSRIYMNEFYMSPWCGQWTAAIILLFRRCFTRKKQSEPLNNSQ